MPGAGAASRVVKSAPEQITDCWLTLTESLAKCIEEFNLTCGHQVWTMSAVAAPAGAVQVRAVAECSACVEIALAAGSGEVYCGYGPCAPGKKLIFQIHTGEEPGFHAGGQPVSLDTLTDMILLPLIGADT